MEIVVYFVVDFVWWVVIFMEEVVFGFVVLFDYEVFVGFLVVEVLCVVVWCLCWVMEVDECLLLYEFDWICSVVYLNKGCYCG